MASTSSLQPRSSVVLVRAAIAALVAVGCGSAHAFTFTIGTVEGSFDSTISAGVGIRTASPSSNLVSPTYNVATGAQTGGGRLGQLSGSPIRATSTMARAIRSRAISRATTSWS